MEYYIISKAYGRSYQLFMTNTLPFLDRTPTEHT